MARAGPVADAARLEDAAGNKDTRERVQSGRRMIDSYFNLVTKGEVRFLDDPDNGTTVCAVSSDLCVIFV